MFKQQKEENNSSKLLSSEEIAKKVDSFVKLDQKNIKLNFIYYLMGKKTVFVFFIAFLVIFYILKYEVSFSFFTPEWLSMLVFIFSFSYVFKKYKQLPVTKKYKIYMEKKLFYSLKYHLLQTLRKMAIEKKEKNVEKMYNILYTINNKKELKRKRQQNMKKEKKYV